MNETELAYCSLAELAELLRSRSVSPVEVARVMIERAERSAREVRLPNGGDDVFAGDASTRAAAVDARQIYAQLTRQAADFGAGGRKLSGWPVARSISEGGPRSIATSPGSSSTFSPGRGRGLRRMR